MNRDQCVPESQALQHLNSVFNNPCNEEKTAGKLEYEWRQCKAVLRQDICEAGKYYWPKPWDFHESVTWAEGLCIEFTDCDKGKDLGYELGYGF